MIHSNKNTGDTVMAKSLHLIHRDRKARGDLRRQKPPLTLAQVRAKIRLPFRAKHLDEEELRKAVKGLNA